MLENSYYIIAIVGTAVITTITTISSIYSLQKSFRDYIDHNLDERDKKLRLWFKTLFEQNYHLIDDRLKVLNLRVKALEKK